MPKKHGLSIVLVAMAAVVVWRVAALVLAESESPLVSLLLALVGASFLLCGLVVYLRVPGRASGLFVWYCICSGLHWGGYLELPEGELRTALILLYLLISGILAAILLLHLALLFPKAYSIADRKPVVGLLYLPAALAALLMLFSQQGFLVVHAIVSNLFSLVALVLIASHLFRSGPGKAEKGYVGLMVVGMLVAWLPYIIASSIGVQETDPWNLTVVALPATFAIALLGMRAPG